VPSGRSRAARSSGQIPVVDREHERRQIFKPPKGALTTAIPAAKTAPDERTKRCFPKVELASALTLAYAFAAAGLITLRALVDALEFLSTGWILLLALVPLAPWLLRAIAPAATRIAPFIKNVKLPGGIEISLSAAERPFTELGKVEEVLTEDHLVGQALMDTPAPFTSTDALRVIQGVQAMRSTGADAVVADLGQGMKWRLPNLYFLAWLLSNDPITRWLVFTEIRADIPGHFVGMCSCANLRASIESVSTHSTHRPDTRSSSTIRRSSKISSRLRTSSTRSVRRSLPQRPVKCRRWHG
jgi:hypothetical protein